MPSRRIPRFALLGLLLALPIGGCRKEPDRTSLEGDIGDGGVILLPTDSTWVKTDLAQGPAEWHPFRNPDEQPPEIDPADAPADANGGNVESVLRKFVTTYNDVVKETKTADDLEGLLDYYVDEQREQIRPVFEIVMALVTTDAELQTEFGNHLADAPGRLVAASTALSSAAPYTLRVASFGVADDGTKTAKLTGGSLFATCSFVLLDQDWYLKAPEGDALATAQTTAEAALATRQGWLSTLQDDSPDVESVIQAIEAVVAANAPATEDAADDGDATKPADDSADDGGGD